MFKNHRLNHRLFWLVLNLMIAVSLLALMPVKNSVAAETRDFYVSLSGNDSNPGTELKPWRTITKAINTVAPGDTVFIREGVYEERPVLRTSGEPGKYITFRNYPGETAIIDGASIDWGYDWNSLFNLNSKNYINIIGLHVINSRYAGIGSTPDDNGCENVLIKDCTTKHTQASGIYFSHASNIIIDGNVVEDACYNTTISTGAQECISISHVSSFKVINNHVFNCSNSVQGRGGEGICIKNGCTDGIVANNKVHGIHKSCIYIDAWARHQYNIEVYENDVYGDATHTASTGIAVATENGGLLEDVNIHHNVCHDLEWGLQLGGWGHKGATHKVGNTSFYNNTIYNITDGGMYLSNSDATKIAIRKNIFHGKNSWTKPIFLDGIKPAETILAGTVIEYNLFDKIFEGYPTGTNYLVGIPSSANIFANNVHLPSDSITFSTLDGKAVNIGAY